MNLALRGASRIARVLNELIQVKQVIESVGLLARVVGRVLSVGTIGKCFYVDDGSGRTNYDGTKVGLKVKSDYTLPGIDQYVSVTGIVSCEPDDTAPDGELIALMLVRQASDVMTF